MKDREALSSSVPEKKFFARQSMQEIKGALQFILLLKPLIVTCKPLVTSMLLLLLRGHRDANSPLSCLQNQNSVRVTQII